MPTITFSDGTKHFFSKNVNIKEISEFFRKKTKEIYIGALIDNQIIDLYTIIKKDSKIDFINIKNTLAKTIIQNTCAYLLGNAIKMLWPNAKMIVGNHTNNGFYYDIDLIEKIKKKDLIKIENKMKEIIKNQKIFQEKKSKKDALNLFIKKEEPYKINEIKNTKSSFINLLFNDTYVDILKNKFLLNLKFCNYFILKNISSINYNNKNTIQRISGIAFPTKNDLNHYLEIFKLSLKRDHRKINKQLHFYHIEKESPGKIFWNHNGWIIFQELVSFIRSKLHKYEYQEVKTPIIIHQSFWEQTGHWEFYKNFMFTTKIEKRKYCIKPMNCPSHVKIFSKTLKSYRMLPFRIAEFGICHRNESSGSLHGLIRSKEFTQDDAHIFCNELQVENEITRCINMIFETYKIFGFKNILVKLSTKPKNSIGDDKVWYITESFLKKTLQKSNISFEYQLGEGAFYGPKIEFILLDSLNRKWQCGTIQLDFFLAKRLNAFYIDNHNNRQFPIIIHRAILGSIERFIGILIEEYAGFFPTWLSPIQIIVVNVHEKNIPYSISLTEKLHSAGFRVKSDLRNKKINFKIREHILYRIPYILICGDKEMNKSVISVRTFYGKNIKNISIKDFIKKIKIEVENRNLKQFLEE